MKLSVNVVGQMLITTAHIVNIGTALVPAQDKFLVMAGLGVLNIVLSILAHYSNPDGTSASAPYGLSDTDLATYQKIFGGVAKAIAIVAIALALTAPVQAQTAAPAPPPVDTSNNGAFQPAYYVGAGSTYDYYGKTGVAAETQVGVRIGSSNFYSWTTLQLGAAASTLHTGGAYLFYQSGNWAMVALADMGFTSTTTTNSFLGSGTAGGLVMYDIGNRITKGGSHFYIGIGAKYAQTASLGSQPLAVLTFGKGF